MKNKQGGHWDHLTCVLPLLFYSPSYLSVVQQETLDFKPPL